MAADIYEYIDAQGRTQRVDDLMKVPPDRLKHMLIIGGEDEPANAATTGAPAKAAAPPPPANSMGGIAMEVWGVSALLMLVAVFNKRFMLRLFCALFSIIWLLYNGYDSFTKSELAQMSERKPRKASAAPPAE